MSLSLFASKLSKGNNGDNFWYYRNDKCNKFLEEQSEDLFECRKHLNKKKGRKRSKFARSDQKFNKITMCKIFTKELEARKSVENNKEEDEEKHMSHVMSLMKKDPPNPSIGIDNASASSTTSDATQEKLQYQN